ncbi:putative sodium-dependent multivitamin transporter [Photinus pyralis]|uniref:putative sodium-dependent multivitamin transporter n=1 Tax=Photinus pyralis TaxID=7054 RepID=UPI0012673D6C|nr:putative sodium-dependent multivitamin transporter [Photinus pyralis]
MVGYTFTWLDYTILCSLLGCSVMIGLYFGFRKKRKERDDYILGGKTNILAVVASLIASNVSGVILVGFPSDIYQFGAMYLWSPVSYIVAIFCAMFITMPVLVNLETASIFYYLEVRFTRKVRLIASTLCVIQTVLFCPITLYVPSILLEQMTGFSGTIISIVTCLFCVFYTTLGGFNAVVWTDVLQTIVMNVCLIVVLIIGFNASGGLGTVWSESVKGGRLDILRFNLDLTTRESIYTIVFSYSLMLMMPITLGQPTLQRLKSLRSYGEAHKAMVLLLLGLVAMNVFVVLVGLTIYSRYSHCDPLLSNKIKNYDQIVAYFVMDTGGQVFGLPGLFITGIFSGGLSTLSTAFNSLPAILYCDFLEPVLSTQFNEKHRDTILKIIVLLAGGVCVILTYLIQYLGGILPTMTSFFGIFGGPVVALYTLGLVFPKSNAAGALVGSATAVVFVVWLFVGHQYFKYKGLIKDHLKPMSIENCESIINSTITVEKQEEEVFVLYRINYWYYTLISFLITITVGYIASLLTRKDGDIPRSELISPWFRRFVPQENPMPQRLMDPALEPLECLKSSQNIPLESFELSQDKCRFGA